MFRFNVGVGILDTEYTRIDPTVPPDVLMLGSRFGQAPDLQYNLGGQREIAPFGTNLTDEFYLNGGFNRDVLHLDFGSIGRPREAGVTLRLFFE